MIFAKAGYERLQQPRGSFNFIFIQRKRNEYEFSADERPIEANEEATGVELHKDSKFFASWQKFKDNNPVVNKFVDYRLAIES